MAGAAGVTTPTPGCVTAGLAGPLGRIQVGGCAALLTTSPRRRVARCSATFCLAISDDSTAGTCGFWRCRATLTWAVSDACSLGICGVCAATIAGRASDRGGADAADPQRARVRHRPGQGRAAPPEPAGACGRVVGYRQAESGRAPGDAATRRGGEKCGAAANLDPAQWFSQAGGDATGRGSRDPRGAGHAGHAGFTPWEAVESGAVRQSPAVISQRKH